MPKMLNQKELLELFMTCPKGGVICPIDKTTATRSEVEDESGTPDGSIICYCDETNDELA